ncbi:hypothetical protein BH11MYX3_BH11MYX3_38930 [soil metagenome]
MNARSLPIVGHVAAGEVAPWIERLARVGFAAKGVLYLTIGALAASAAIGHGGKSVNDSRGAMGDLLGTQLGRPLLAVIAIGLFGYALWRIIEGFTDPEHRGRDAKGIAMRIGFVINGLIHLALAGTAASLALWSRGGGHGSQAKHWTGRALEMPGGVYLVYAGAAGVLGYGIYQLYRAWKAKLDKQLRLGELSSGTRRAVIAISRFGIAARALVFGTIGVLLGRAAMHENPREAGGIRESMRELGSLGKWPFFVLAVGLGAYGIYQLIAARYRRVEVR